MLKCFPNFSWHLGRLSTISGQFGTVDPAVVSVIFFTTLFVCVTTQKGALHRVGFVTAPLSWRSPGVVVHVSLGDLKPQLSMNACTYF